MIIQKSLLIWLMIIDNRWNYPNSFGITICIKKPINTQKIKHKKINSLILNLNRDLQIMVQKMKM